ncbi:CFI-box-CTERM domain-containing protein [Pedobacter sp.]|jgi:ribosomal protein L7/L12|uniref:CFI-box-CTERM domain-containing protein n=1 Tax=Pedobacter sp. TaxID=1411316 RepID=UPI002D018160|nr:CFI-box-CTERM domain-containing protein [Pedobacter sp.]HWW42057.1 CFI-box-CTERM domain-containing protein [Pedobacter sp.]
MIIISKEQEAQILLLLQRNRKIEAVKLVMDAAKCGLKEAKDFIDQFTETRTTSAGGKERSLRENLDAELTSLLLNGKKIDAVKLYKDHTGAGLKDSVDYVNSLQEGEVAPLSRSPLNKRDTQIDEIIKGQQEQKPKTGCFIATVCYGNYDAPEVMVLRRYRDERLMPFLAGRLFVRFYYFISPALAKQLDKSERGKGWVKTNLLAPVVLYIGTKITKNKTITDE